MKTVIIIFTTGLLNITLSANNCCENTGILYSSKPTQQLFLSNQETTESVSQEETYREPTSPARAAMLSATLPGLGQIYNQKYWKVPVIYAGFGAVIYFLDFNNSYYQKYQKAYQYRVDGNPHTQDDFPQYDADVLRRARDYYRRNLEITYIAAAALYILNILDASVDAHLMDFDISEDLSMSMKPSIEKVNYGKYSNTGLRLTINF